MWIRRLSRSVTAARGLRAGGAWFLLAAVAPGPPPPAADQRGFTGLAQAFAAIAAAADGTLGAAALLVESGEQAVWNGEARFPMQSVYKAPIAMVVLRDVDAGRLQLEAPVRVESGDLVPAAMHSPLRDRHPRGGVEVPLRELLRLAVQESDGTASDVLLRTAGGQDRAQQVLRAIGIEDLRIATTEADIGRDFTRQYHSWSTPREAARWLALLQQSTALSRASRDLLLGFMSATTTGAKRLRGALPPGTPVAHKTGSSGTHDGIAAATNDIGLVTLPDGRHLAIAVFLSDSRADADERDAVIARVARAAWDAATGAGLALRPR